MAKRMNKREVQGAVALGLVGGTIWLASKIVEALGGVRNAIILVAVAAVAWIAVLVHKRYVAKAQAQARYVRLKFRYQDDEIVQRIITKTLWHGELAEHVFESLGQAEDIDHKVLKSQRREVWKYGHEGGNRFRLRITLENGAVVGWEHRSR